MNNDYEDIFDKFFGHVRLASCSPKFAAPYGKKPEVTVSFTRVSDDGTDELYEATGATSEEAMANLRAQLDDADEVTAQQHAKLWDNILEYAELASTSDVDEDFEEVEAKLGPLADIIGSIIAEAIDEEDEDFYEDVYERLEALEDKVEDVDTQWDRLSSAADAVQKLNERLVKLEHPEEDDSIKVTPHQLTCLSNLLDDMLKAINDIIDRTAGLFTNPHEINRKAGGIRADLGVCKAMLEDIKND